MNSKLKMSTLAGGFLAGLLTPTVVHACACGCGVFDVATSYMLPNGPGGMIWSQYSYQDQTQNWSGSGRAPSADNDDKEIETHFIDLGFQYMFNNKWGVSAELPYDFRYFRGTLDDGSISSHHWSTFGDLKLQAIYTGFSSNMSSGFTLGLKLPTGGFHIDTDLVDRDTQIGTGSTDLLVGGFHRGNIAHSADWEWFAQFQLDLPTFIQADYRPGVEFDAAAGIDYAGFSIGRTHIVPIAQVLFSERASDSGAAADPENTGYQRLLLSPALEVNIHPVDIYADVEFPVFQNFTGDQLAASVMFKFAVTYMFN
jgi:hypothetical protein